jgi:organic hydroperoxide reductase OsmC/OhrA
MRLVMKGRYYGFHDPLTERPGTSKRGWACLATESHANPMEMPTEARMDERRFQVVLSRRQRYEFAARYDDPALPELRLDEAPPLGEGHGPNAARVLGAAVGNCLAASLLFCLSKARVDVGDLDVNVNGTITRNPEGRARVGELRVRLSPSVPEGSRERLDRCLGLFEDFCMVSASVRQGITIHVEVAPTVRP